MLSNRKNKIYSILFFILALSFSCYAESLILEIKNEDSSEISIKYLKSNKSLHIEPVTINPGEIKKIQTDFDGNFFASLEITDSKSQEITEFQVFCNHEYSREFSFLVPGGGSLENWGCAWNKNRIIINKINGYRHNPFMSWLPFNLPSYHAEISFTVTKKKTDLGTNSDGSNLEFTLFALPVVEEISEIQLNTDIEKKLSIKDKKLSLENWDIQEYVNLNSTAFTNTDNSLARWVELIIHNYTAKSFMLYGIDEKPGDDQIEFSYKENYKPDFTVFYPPQTQLKGPGFQFKVDKEKENFILHPGENEKDRYFLIIGQQTDLSKNILEYIPLEIKTGIRLGKSMEKGVRINAYDDFAYQAEFIPVNVSFSAESVSPEEVSEKIRVPFDENGKLMFQLNPLTDITVNIEKNSDNPDANHKNRVAVKYLISGKSDIDKKVYSYRLILFAPPFLAGNTPGKFSPGQNLPPDIDIGNFLRYPLHLYLMSVNENNKEENIEGYETVTELPDELIGSIEYFVGDLNHIHKNIEEEKEENRK